MRVQESIKTIGAELAPDNAKAVASAQADARYRCAAGALLVVFVTGYAQERVQPYALRMQNLLARWMYCSSALAVGAPPRKDMSSWRSL